MLKKPHTVQANLTAVTQDYLKALWTAHIRGDGLTINQIAHKMGVVASTASENVARLKAHGLVEHEPYRKVHLSPQGQSLAVGMIRRHRILETYLHRVLGFEWDEVHEEAEALEHAISDRLLARLDSALGYPQRDPHGDPIPEEDGSCIAPQTTPLATLAPGQVATVGRICDHSSQILRDLEIAGITLDVPLSIHTVEPDGSMHVRIGQEPHAPIRYLTRAHIEAIEIIDETSTTSA